MPPKPPNGGLDINFNIYKSLHPWIVLIFKINISKAQAKKNQTKGELNKASLALIRGDNKLVYFSGYKHYQDKYEFYNLINDPQELDNRFNSSLIAEEMQVELDRKYAEIKNPVD